MIIDLRGFRETSTGTFIVKELAVSGDTDTVFLFNPPPSVSTSSHWMTTCHHGLQLNSGFVAYNDLAHILENITRNQTCVYTKGLSNKKFLEQYLSCYVCDLENFGCPNLNMLKNTFPSQHPCFSISRDVPVECALQNVRVLKSWWLRRTTLLI